MQLRKIALRNFKCFQKVNVECSKFTLLAGANSSGKSNLIYSVLGALQTKNYPFYFSPNGRYVNMGDFVEIAFNHRKSSVIGINLGFFDEGVKDVGLTFDGVFSLNRKTRLPRLIGLNFESPSLDLNLRKNKVFKGHYRFRPEREKKNWRQSEEFRDVMRTLLNLAEKSLSAEPKRKARRKRGGKGSTEQYLKEIFEYRKEEKFSFTGSADLFRQLGKRPFLRQQIWDVVAHISEFDKTFNYISSFRLPPERTYYERTKAALKVEKFGENWVEQIVEWEQSRSKQLERLKTAARKLSLFDDLRSTRYTGGRYEIRVTPHNKCIESSLVDVGFGISQFLPILVADAQLEKGSTLAVSQPEIHLHPSVQAEFANYLVETHNREKKRYIIETHSEYLLNRFRLLIAKKQLDPNDVAVYYLDRARGRARCHRLIFRADGKIEGAPKEFFRTYMMDVMDIAMNA